MRTHSHVSGLLLALFLILGFGSTHSARAEVLIAERLTFLSGEGTVVVPPGQRQLVSLRFLDHRDTATITVNVLNQVYRDIGLIVCDEANAQRFLNSASYSCHNYGVQRGYIKLNVSPYSEAEHYLILDNSHANFLKKTVAYRSVVETSLPTQPRALLKETLEDMFDQLTKMFIVPELDFSIVPCGYENAFSAERDGAISLCSDLFLPAVLDNKPGVYLGVLSHELGHSLLNLWGEPNYHNEQVADEFAAVFLILGKHEKYAWEWVDWYTSRQNIQAEVQAIIQTGDSHPLSIQRANSIKRILTNPHTYLARWKPILFRHMTSEALSSWLEQGVSNADRAIIDSILNERAAGSSTNSDIQ